MICAIILLLLCFSKQAKHIIRDSVFHVPAAAASSSPCVSHFAELVENERTVVANFGYEWCATARRHYYATPRDKITT